MITRIISVNKSIISIGIPLGLLVVSIFVMRSVLVTENDLLALAISIDLLISVPLIYFLLIRKTSIPNATVIPVMMIGLMMGTYFLPKESQTYLTLFKTWILPVIETSILVLIVYKVRALIKKYKRIENKTVDFYSTLKISCYEMLPKKLAVPIATEVAVMYYGFINWKSRKLVENEFSYHLKSGTQTLLGVFIFLIAMETIAIHLLLSSWSILAAWILTGLSIYTAIQMLGVLKSLSKRPISVNDNSLTLRYGILSEVEIPFVDIDKVILSRKPIRQEAGFQKLSPLSELESHNVIIELNRENTIEGLYGLTKKCKVLAFHVDREKAFKQRLEKVISISE